jgi:DNA-binding beta-propeller fold protein YncE
LNAGSTDNISVIDLTANPPRTVKNIVCGNVGISWINYGIRSNLAITEDGSRGVLAVPFDDGVQIIDLEDDEVETTFPVEGFPLQSVLSDEIEGKVYAAVTLRNGNQVWIAEDVLGDVVPFGGVDVGTAPTRMGYDPASKRFAVCSNTDRTVSFIDPLFFEVNETKTYGPTHTPISVEFNAEGDQFTLLRSNETGRPHQLDINDERVDLPGLPCHYMALSPDGTKAAIPAIANDAVYLVDANVTSSEDVTVIDLGEPFIIAPSPFTSHINLISNAAYESEAPRVEIIDMNGRFAAGWQGMDSPDLSHLASGTYGYRIMVDGRTVQQGRVIKK